MKIDKQIVWAFVYQDHMGDGWYAYYPTTDDSLDAEGSIPARSFHTREAAERHVEAAIEAAATRPRTTAIGMREYVITP